MNSPFSTDKKYVDQRGVDYLYIGFHPARTTHPFVFTRQDGVGIFFVDEEGNIMWSDKRTLHEVKPKITRWLSIWNSAYFKGDKVYSHLTEADARNSRPVPDKTTKAAIVKIEFEEGEGL